MRADENSGEHPRQKEVPDERKVQLVRLVLRSGLLRDDMLAAIRVVVELGKGGSQVRAVG